MAGNEIDIDAIEALLSTFGPPGRRAAATISLDDALAIVAEVRRLRDELDELRTQLLCDVALPVYTERGGPRCPVCLGSGEANDHSTRCTRCTGLGFVS